MNNRKNDKRKNESSIGGLIIAAIFIFSIIGDADGVALVVLIFIAIAAAVIYIAYKASKQAKENGSSSVSTEDMKKVARESFSKVMTEVKKEAETKNCDNDHAHVEASYNLSADDKRLYQLKEMLKNGIIGREEYNILLRRYGYK